MRATFNVGHRRYVAGATDAHGNPVEGFAPTVDLPVYGTAPYSAVYPEPTVNRDETDTRLSVFCLPGTVLGSKDQLVIDGLDYEVIGTVSDYTKGPYGGRMGVVYTARRVEG